MNTDPPDDSTTQVDETLPDELKAYLRSGGPVETIRLDREGRWFHEGDPIENPRIIRLFNRIVTRTEGGTWLLVAGRSSYPIQVEDTAFFVESIDLTGDPPLVALSDGSEEPLDASTVNYRPVGRLYCSVKGGAFRARFTRALYHALADRMEEEKGKVYLNLGTLRVYLAELEDEPEDAG
jgi:hypothetical protein